MTTYDLYTKECLSCESSQTGDDGEPFCIRLESPYSKNCPCHDCVIKVMCGHSCEDYRIYWELARTEVNS